MSGKSASVAGLSMPMLAGGAVLLIAVATFDVACVPLPPAEIALGSHRTGAEGLDAAWSSSRPLSAIHPLLMGNPKLMAALGPIYSASTEGKDLARLPFPTEALPASVDLRPELSPVRDQADRPLCEILAVCAALDHLSRDHPHMAARSHSPEFLWWNYQRLVVSQLAPGRIWGDQGTEGPYLALLLQRTSYQDGSLTLPGEQGVIAEALAPLIPGLAASPPGIGLTTVSQVHLGSLADRIAAGERFGADGALARFVTLDPATLKLVLARRHPIICGFPESVQSWQQLTATNDLIAESPASLGEGRRGHVVLLTGYQDDPALPGGGAFRFRNSLGPGWADGGYGRVSYRFVETWGDSPYYLEPLLPHFHPQYALTYP